MDLAEYDREYNTDEVSINSSVLSEEKETYTADKVLAEYVPDGEEATMYLIKWSDYPWHRCTPEPLENLARTNLLDIWAKKKKRLGKVKLQEHMDKNFRRVSIAQQKAEEAKKRRHEKRLKKRKKLQPSKAIQPIKSDSNDDRPILSYRNTKAQRYPKRNTTTQTDVPLREENPSPPLPETIKRGVRKQPVVLSSEDEQSNDGDSDASRNSQAKQIGANPAPRDALENDQQKNEKPASNSPHEEKSPHEENPQNSSPLEPTRKTAKEIDPPQDQPAIPIESLANDGATPVQQNSSPDARASETSEPVVQRRGSAANRVSPPNPTPTVESITAVNVSAAVRQSPEASDPVASIKQPVLSSTAIKMVNQPKTTSRKSWNTSDTQYKTLKFRGIAQKRSRIEATPDPGVLDFVNASPLGPTPKEGNDGRALKSVKDNPYARREIGRRQLQEADEDEAPEEVLGNSAQLRSYEIGKIPLSCSDWRNGSCSFTPETCRFMHRTSDPSGKPYIVAPWNNAIPPKYASPPVTCWYWLRGPQGCDRSADDCKFAHENTGLLGNKHGAPQETIDRNEKPKSSRPVPVRSASSTKTSVTCWFWFKLPKGCSKPADKCQFAHKNTGLLGNTDGRPFEPINPLERPFSMTNDRQTHDSVHPPRTGSAPLAPASHHTPKRNLKPSEITCFFWSEGRCKNSAETCPYRHEWGATIADPPPNFRPRHDLQSPVPEQGYNKGFKTIMRSNEAENALSPFSRPVETFEGTTSSASLRKQIETVCKLDYAEMFTHNDDIKLDERAFLIFQPEDHMEELELITRWLTMHRVEVYSLWLDGAWDQFKQQIVDGGTGIIIAHSDFEHFADIPNFGDVLRQNVKLWSVGHQEAYEYDPEVSTIPPVHRHDRIEIFPHGGFIYITDDVFEHQPQEALKIVNLFFSKVEKCRQVDGPIDPWKRIDDGCLLWRLGVRPELMQSIYDRYVKQEGEMTAGDPDHASRFDLYKLLSRDDYIEQDDPGPWILHPVDYFPIISERREVMEDYYLALAVSQAEANLVMVQYFAGVVVDQRKWYRHYFVVHTEPEKVNWKSTVQNIDEIMTPKKCIEILEQPSKGSRFDFYEWQFAEKEGVGSAAA